MSAILRPDLNDPRWKAMTTSRCFCSGCGEYFTSLSGFDRHQKAGECRPPSDVGMILNDSGYWQFPGNRPALLWGKS